MQRYFELEEIDLERFNLLCRKADVPVWKVGTSSVQYSALFTTILNPLRYSNMDELLSRLSDDEQHPYCVWYPKGNVSKGRAERLTLKDQKSYFRCVADNQDLYTNLLVSLTWDLREARFQDSFDFVKVDGDWTLGRVVIKSRNFWMYEFRGLQANLSEIQDIAGVNDTEYSLETRLKIDTSMEPQSHRPSGPQIFIAYYQFFNDV
jgi:hypothetical protein